MGLVAREAFNMDLVCGYMSQLGWVQAVVFVVPVTPVLTCGVTRRKLQTPGNAEEHKRQKTPHLWCACFV